MGQGVKRGGLQPVGTTMGGGYVLQFFFGCYMTSQGPWISPSMDQKVMRGEEEPLSRGETPDTSTFFLLRRWGIKTRRPKETKDV